MDSPLCCLLSDVPSGSVVRIQSLKNNGAERSRLYALGILPGTELEVCTGCGGHGGRRIRVRHSSLVLDEHLAQGVECVALPENEIQHHSHHVGHDCRKGHHPSGHSRDDKHGQAEGPSGRNGGAKQVKDPLASF